MTEEVTNEVVDDSDADFDAGFEQAPDLTTTPETAAEETPVVEAVATPTYAQITEDQFKDLVAKANSVDEFKAEAARKFDTAFGQLGGMKQVIERLKDMPAGVQATEEDFAELRSEFPELADLQMKGINKVLSKLKGSGGSSASDGLAVQALQTQLSEAREDAIDRLHDIVPSWQDAVKTPAFTEWHSKQDEATKALSASNNVRDAAKMLRMFRDRPVTKTPPAPAVSTRQRQLEAAVTTRGSRGAALEPSAVDDFEAGFNSARN